jgi:glycosyltransferase involved in cell wall biosynthesis
MPYILSKIGFGDWDVVTATSFPWSSAVLAYYGAKIGNMPYIVIPLFHVGHPEYECYSLFDLLQKANAIITLTSYEAEYLTTKAIPHDKIHVIGAGVNPNDFIDANGERFKEKHGLIDSPLILFLGNRTASKGIFTLIESMKYVKQRYPDVRLILAGRSGREYNEYYSTLPLELQSSILDVGVLSKQEKADAFSAADIFVMPSKFESIGLVYLEAWMCSTPVIGSYSPTISNVINDGEDGFLIDFGDSVVLGKKIVHLLKNDMLREEMGKVGRNKVLKKYTWNTITSKIEALYLSVVNNY